MQSAMVKLQCSLVSRRRDRLCVCSQLPNICSSNVQKVISFSTYLYTQVQPSLFDTELSSRGGIHLRVIGTQSYSIQILDSDISNQPTQANDIVSRIHPFNLCYVQFSVNILRISLYKDVTYSWQKTIKYEKINIGKRQKKTQVYYFANKMSIFFFFYFRFCQWQ